MPGPSSIISVAADSSIRRWEKRLRDHANGQGEDGRPGERRRGQHTYLEQIEADGREVDR